MTPLRRVVRRADDRDRARVEQRPQVASCLAPTSRSSSHHVAHPCEPPEWPDRRTGHEGPHGDSSARPRRRIAELTEREQQRLDERTPGSARAVRARARGRSPAASPPSYQVRDPWPIYLSHGQGSRVWDVDGNEMLDFHNGFGSMVQGHAHPAIVRAVADARRARDALRRADRGRDRRRRGARAALRAAALALRQLRLRGDDGRDPDRARAHRPRHDRQDLRLLPRPPRRRDGLDRRRRTTQIGDRENYASLPYGAGIPQAVAD